MSEKGSYFEKSYKPLIKLDDKLVTDLFNIVGNMNLNEIKQFVMIENITFNVYDRFGNNLIHHILLENDLLKTESQRLLIIKYLYEEHVNPDAPNNLNQTPLHIACIKQYMNIIKYLIELGVDINYKDNFGNTPLHKLFSGNIKLEEKTTISNIVPLPKIQDTISTNTLKEESKKLWESIKKSPFLESIVNTMKNSFNINNEGVELINSFQNKLLNIMFKSPSDNESVITNLYQTSNARLKTLIESKWNNFSLLTDIISHQTEENSYPESGNRSIIKNSNGKKYLIKLIKDTFESINTFSTNTMDLIDINAIVTNYTQIYLTNSSFSLAESEAFPIKKDYQVESFDYSQNIIKISENDNYFIGGPRICNIIEPLDIEQVIYLESLDINQVKFIIYNMFLSHDELKKIKEEQPGYFDNYTLMENIAEYIYNNHILESNKYKDNINKLLIDIYKTLWKHINKKITDNFITKKPSESDKLESQVFTFINNIIIQDISNLVSNISLNYLNIFKERLGIFEPMFNIIFTINEDNVYDKLKECIDDINKNENKIKRKNDIVQNIRTIKKAREEKEDDFEDWYGSVEYDDIIKEIEEIIFIYNIDVDTIINILNLSTMYNINFDEFIIIKNTYNTLSDSDKTTNQKEINDVLDEYNKIIEEAFIINYDNIYKLIDTIGFTNVLDLPEKYNDPLIEHLIADIFIDFINKNKISEYNQIYIKLIAHIICKYITNPADKDIKNNLINLHKLYDKIVNIITEYFLNENLNAELFSTYKELLDIITFNQYNNYRDYNLLKKYNDSSLDKINWLYSFVTEILGLMHPKHNLECNMRMSIILLFAGLINKKSDDLILSIKQSMRIVLHPLIKNNGRFGFADKNADDNIKKGALLSAWLYILLSEENSSYIQKVFDPNEKNKKNEENDPNDPNKEIDPNEEIVERIIMTLPIEELLTELLVTTFNLMNEDPRKNIIERNKLCNSIIEYYKKMKQPPQYSHIADVIKLIKNPDVYNNFINRMTNLIIPVYNNNNNKIEMIEPNIKEEFDFFKSNNIDFFYIINNEIIFISLWAINEYSLPSRLNYFLFKSDKEYNSIIYNSEEDNIIEKNNNKKFIESYYLGLNFMGHVPQIDNITEIKNSKDAIINPEIDLFNFNISDKPILFTYNVNELEYFHRPMTNFSIPTILNIFEFKINNLITILVDKLKNNIKEFNTYNNSELYAYAISYIYPYLVNLYNYSQLFINYNNIYKINDDTNDILDSFKIFDLSLLESYLNNLNAYIFLLYYLSATKLKMKIPKLFYHSLGNDILILYDNNNNNIFIDENIQSDENEIDDTNTNNLNNNLNDQSIGLYQQIIKNIGLVNKNVMNELFVMSKNTKLPPSINNYLYEFYRINLIELIKTNDVELNQDILQISGLNESIKQSQLLLMKAKMIEDMVRSYLLYQIEESVKQIYMNFIQNDFKIPPNIKSKLFPTKPSPVQFTSIPSDKLINSIYNDNKKLISLKYFYSFVEPKNIKEQFYIYPDNYFGTNLLKTKYVVNINNDIIKYMMEQNCNITCHNNEKISPLVMFMRNKYYPGLNIIKTYMDLRDFYDKKTDSPYKYLLNTFKLHLQQYSTNFINYQYDEIEQLIQSNESFYNNIMKHMKTSFQVVKYLTEQYLTENMLHFSDDFTFDNLTQIKNICRITSNIDLTDIHYNKKLGNLRIPSNNIGIIINEIIDILTTKQVKYRSLITKYDNELRILGRNNIDKTGINTKKTDIEKQNINNTIRINNLKRIPKILQKTVNLNLPTRNIIQRYENLINHIRQNMLCYMTGWSKLLDDTNLVQENNIDITPSILVEKQIDLMQEIDLNFINNLAKIQPFYKLNHDIVKEYFENPRFLDNNEPLEFVNDLLIHMTKTFICSNIESVIEKILYEYFANNTTEEITDTIYTIEYIVSLIKDKLYNELPAKFVKNSCNIFKDQHDQAATIVETVSEILGNLIDIINIKSPIKIDYYTINIFKSNIIPYFDTIIYKLINNWNVVIENIFLFHINHFRILNCLKVIL